jgi:hypothetical protein
VIHSPHNLFWRSYRPTVIFFSLLASSTWTSSLYFFFIGLIAVLLFMWYISYITYLILFFFLYCFFFVHIYCLLNDIRYWSERPMFFGPCDKFPIWTFSPLVSSLRYLCPSSCFLFMGLIALLLFHVPHRCTIVHVIHLLHNLSHSFFFSLLLFFLTYLLFFEWHSLLIRNTYVFLAMWYISHMHFLAPRILPPFTLSIFMLLLHGPHRFTSFSWASSLYYCSCDTLTL